MSEGEAGGPDVAAGRDSEGLEFTQESVCAALDEDGLEHTQEFVAAGSVGDAAVPDTAVPDTAGSGSVSSDTASSGAVSPGAAPDGVAADGTSGVSKDGPARRTGPGTTGTPGVRRRPHVDVTPTAMLSVVSGRSGAARRRRDWVDAVDHWFPERYRVPMMLTSAVSLALTVGFLFLPLAGTDLSAQVARGHFFEAYGWHTVDFRWYGGVFPFGYSLLAGPLNALLGARGVGAVSCVLGSTTFAWLLARHRVRRPALGGVLAAMVGVFNLVSGRTTFALGLAIGLFALVVVTVPRVPRWPRLGAGLVVALAATTASPLAGLFVGLAGGAVLLGGLRRAEPTRRAGHTRRVGPARRVPGPHETAALRREAALRRPKSRLRHLWRRVPRLTRHLTGAWREGLVLCLGALVGLVPSLMFPDQGVQPFTSDSMKVFVAVGVAAFFLVPAGYRVLRVGAVLVIVLTLLAYFVPSPVGSNVTRLPMLYCAPLIAAVCTVDRRLLVGAILALTWWQPPLITGDLGSAGNPAAQSVYYQPLIDRLAQSEPIGRVEVVPLFDHWESTYVAEAVPLARGWERQVDVQRNPIFYGTALAPDTYLSWLYHNAVSYVAVASQDRLDKYGREEANLISAKLPYLKRDWSNSDWTLYRVLGAQQLVTGAGVLVDSGPTGVTFDTTVSGGLTVRVRWSRWLTLSGPDACFYRRPDDWVGVRVNSPGRYRLSSGWHLHQAHHC